MKLHLSLQNRLYLAFVDMALLVLAASAAAFFFNREVTTTFTTARAGFSEIQSLTRLQRRSQEVSGMIDRLFQTHQVEAQRERLTAGLKGLRTELETTKQTPDSALPEKTKENQAILAKMQVAVDGIEETVTEILSLAEAGQWSIARDLRETLLAAQQADLNEQMEQLAQNIEADVQSTFIVSARSQDITSTVTIAITALAVLAAGFLGFLSTKSITNPLNQLISVVQRVTLHDFSPVPPLSQKDEIGALSQSIALMTDWLRQSYESLEERVEERTDELEQQNLQIQVAAEIARDASSARELDLLLDQAVQLIMSRFGFYHAGIFLMDENDDYAILKAASGPSSQAMIESGHKLRVGEVGIVGYVARSGKARIALDVGMDAVHFQNPLLPDTHSELALPMKVGNQVLGVLDVQSELPAAFKDSDINVLQILADLLAVGIQNAQLNIQLRDSYTELENFYSHYSQDAWKKVVHTQAISGYQYDENGAHPILKRPSKSKSGSEKDQPDASIPLKVRGDTVGILKVWAGDRPLNPDDVELLQDLGLRLGQSLDSARLFTETQRRAEYERLAGQVAARMRQSMDIESVLRSAAEDIYQVLNLEQLTIDLSTPLDEARGNGHS